MISLSRLQFYGSRAGSAGVEWFWPLRSAENYIYLQNWVAVKQPKSLDNNFYFSLQFLNLISYIDLRGNDFFLYWSDQDPLFNIRI